MSPTYLAHRINSVEDKSPAAAADSERYTDNVYITGPYTNN